MFIYLTAESIDNFYFKKIELAKNILTNPLVIDNVVIISI